MLTRRGVETDLKNSQYVYIIKNITYYFSSIYYRDKFINKLVDNRKLIFNQLKNLFDSDINIYPLADILLYSKTEKRGFFIKIGGLDIPCKNSLIYHGIKISFKNYQDQ